MFRAFTLFRVKSSRSHAFAAAFEPRKSFAPFILAGDSFDSEKWVYRAAHSSKLSLLAQIITTHHPNKTHLNKMYKKRESSVSISNNGATAITLSNLSSTPP